MTFAKPVMLVAVLLAFLDHHVETHLPDATWMPVPLAAFTATDRYPASLPNPAVPPGFNWSLPYPDSAVGAWPDNTGCNYNDPYVSGIPRRNNRLPMQIYDTSGKLETGAIERTNPAYIYRTGMISEVRGFAVQARFTGEDAVSGGSDLWQAAFYHSQRCYGAATEVGFFRQIGAAGGAGLVFYYNINANCSPAGKCRVQKPGADWENLQEQTDGVAIPIPPGGGEWMYAAWLSVDESEWNITRRDPVYPFAIRASVTRPVLPWFAKYAHEMANGRGLQGYVTLTSQISGAFPTPLDSTMDVVAAYTPFWGRSARRHE